MSKMVLDQHVVVEEKTKKYGFGVRHVQSFLLFLTMSMALIIRVDMSVAIIAMTDNSTSLEHVETYTWNKKTQDVILSSFFWGYMLMQIPSGQLAHRYGVKILLVTAMLGNGIINIVTPWAISFGGWRAICVCRALQGLMQAALFPCVHTFLSKWVPKREQSRLANVIYSGTSVGTIAGMALSSILASTAIGWPCIFYVLGVLGISVGVLLWVFSASTPQSHKSISAEEKFYIETSLKNVSNKKALKTPWRSIFTSLPILALAIGHIGLYWGFLTLLTETPTYLKRGLGIDVKRSGLLSALPYSASWIGSIVLSFVSDHIVNKNICSRIAARRIFNTIGSWGPAVGLIILGYVPPGNEILAICVLITSVGLMSGMNMGYMLNHIDLSPNFAGTLMAVTNFFANLIGVLAPITVGYILEDDTDLKQWRLAFCFTATVLLLTNLVFIIFSSGDVQPWNEPKNAIVMEENKMLNDPVIKHNP